MANRYNIVDYDGNSIATAKTKWEALLMANAMRGQGYHVSAVIDEKNLYPYKFRCVIWGAGHEVLQYEGMKAVCHDFECYTASVEGYDRAKRMHLEA